MSKNKVLQTQFKASFLLPKYWLTWLAVIILGAISWLPYKLQMFLGKVVGRILMKLGGSRYRAAKKNIDTCFPELTESERIELLTKNFENTGRALFETGIGWWWPDWRMKRIIHSSGIEHLEKAKSEGNGVLVLAMHNLCLEACGRGVGIVHPTVVFYRPNHNELMEFFQHRGRARSNKYMLDKSDVKGMVAALRDGESCVYLPDQDYGRRRSLFVPFFNVPDAATTLGTMIFAKRKGVKTLMLETYRRADGNGYQINFSPVLDNFPSDDDAKDLTRVNQELEKLIRKNPEQYMWLHRRFKTRPNKDDPKFYT